MTVSIWPLFGLTVATPRLTLRYVDDALAGQLAELAARGVHDPATMPFSEPWTDVPPPEQQRNTMRYLWTCRAQTRPDEWTLTFAACERDTVVGMCGVSASHFPTRRDATTGSWLGRAHQRRGLGREMRQAALHLLFAGLGADVARTRAWHDNAASLGVTRALPYTEGEPVVETRRSRSDMMLTFSMGRQQWEPLQRNDITLGGLQTVRGFLGLEP